MSPPTGASTQCSSLQNTPGIHLHLQVAAVTAVQRYIRWGVLWHTGKVLACSAIGSCCNLQQGLFCSVSGWHTTPVARRVGLVLEHFLFTNATSQWLYFSLVCRFHTRLGRFFSGYSSFVLHLKIGILPYFWSMVSGFSLCYKACLAASGLTTYVCAAAVIQLRLENPLG